MACAKIVILASNCELDSYRDNQYQLSIEIPEGKEIPINKKTEQIIDLDKIISDYSNSFELDLSEKEIQILGSIQYRKITSSRNRYRGYLIKDDIVQLDGFVYIEQVSERVFDGLVRVKVQVIGTHQEWKDYLANNTMSALDLGVFDFQLSEVIDIWFNNEQYIDGGTTIYPLLANFGKFFGDPVPNLYDIRFVVYIKPILDQMFCQAGYTVRSRFANTEYFRRQSLYLLKNNFGLESSTGSGTYVDLALSTTTTPGPAVYEIPFDILNYDNSGKWDGVNYEYSNNTNKNIYNVVLDINVIMNNPNGGAGINTSLSIAILDSGGTPIFTNPSGLYIIPESIRDTTIDPNTTAMNPGENFQVVTTLDLSQLLRDLLINEGFIEPGWRILFYHSNNPLNAAPLQGIILAGATYKIKARSYNHFNQFDLIDIAKVSNQEFNLLQFLKDLKKLFGWKFETIQSEKVVEIEPANDYQSYKNFDLFSVIRQGFLGNPNDPFDFIDITDLVDVCQYITRKFPEISQEKTFRFKFKDSTDNYSRYDSFGEESPELWENIIGESKEEIEEIELNIIEPTLNDFEIGMAPPADDPKYDIYIPFIWERQQDEDSVEYPEQGANIAPRILFVYGFKSQVVRIGDFLDNVRFQIESTVFEQVPNIGQLFEIEISLTPTTSGIPEQNIVFKDNLSEIPIEKNLVNTFYTDLNNKENLIVELDISTKISNLLFRCFSPRKIYRIFSQKDSLMRFNNFYRLISIKKDINSDSLIKMVFKPIVRCDIE